MVALGVRCTPGACRPQGCAPRPVAAEHGYVDSDSAGQTRSGGLETGNVGTDEGVIKNYLICCITVPSIELPKVTKSLGYEQ